MKREYNLLPNLEPIVYATSPFHMLLDSDTIGENGENLSIIVLSCERADATIKMMESIKEHIPDFKGEYIIADNGSNADTIQKLKEEISKVPYECKLIEFGKNYGVAGGRNRAIKYSTKKWVMNLDNDIYFTTNILPEINDTILQLGCKFVNVPLLNYDANKIFSLGGNLFLTNENEEICAGCGGSYEQSECEPGDTFNRSLCTFLFGTSVINKEKFLEIGGFDEGMFIGFEDLDLSIEIFKRGYKIGCIGIAGLVHDHRISTSENDIEYEKKRFSNKYIYESAKYFEQKHGFKVWNSETEQWLKEKTKSLGINENTDSKKVEASNNVLCKKPKVALIVDVRNWAFDNIAKNLKRFLSDKFDIEIIYNSPDMNENIVHIFYAVKDFDLVHFFWRGILNFIDAEFYKYYLTYYGSDITAFSENYIQNKIITTSVYDHKYLIDGSEEVNKNMFKHVKEYTVSSKKLFDIYNNLGYIKKPGVEITDGVDLEFFKPNNISRLNNLKNRKLVIGWVGNSKWHSDTQEDVKGFNTIIKPAIEELIEENYSIELYAADKNVMYVPFDKMPEYYEKIDLYICASLHEGTPNPVLESMACGIPVISTDVGIVSEVFGDKQKQFILEERTKECLKEKIKYLLNDLDLLPILSEENLQQIKDWSWENKAKQFGKFFDDCLNDTK